MRSGEERSKLDGHGLVAWGAGVLRSLFPETTDRVGGGHEWLWGLGAGLAAAVITVARAPFMFDSFWAEDGSRFYQEALTKSTRSVFFGWYAGYLQAIPRLIASLAVRFPVRDAPAVFAVCVLVIVAAGAALVEVRLGAYISRRWLRVGVALSVGYLPVLREEVIGNVANIQFLLVFFAFWMLLWIPRRWFAIAAAAGILMLISLSTLVAVFLVPVALARLFVRGRRVAWLAPVAFLSGLAVQFGGRAIVHADRPVEGVGRWTALDWFNARVVDNVRPASMVSASVHAPVIVMVAIAVVLVGSFIGGPAQHHDRGAIPALTARTLTAVTLGMSLVTGFGLAVSAGTTLRYAVVPALFLVTALGVASDRNLDARPNPSGWVPVAIVVAATLTAAYSTREPSTWRGEAAIVTPTSAAWGAPWWSAGVDTARAQCRNAPLGAVNIKSFPAPWVVTVPCSDLLH